jgi:predicted MFS family arabinose efflux permease
VAGYRLSFLIAAVLALLAGVIVAVQLSSRAGQQELASQREQPDVTPGVAAEAQLRKC